MGIFHSGVNQRPNRPSSVGDILGVGVQPGKYPLLHSRSGPQVLASISSSPQSGDRLQVRLMRLRADLLLSLIFSIFLVNFWWLERRVKLMSTAELWLL